MLSGNFPRTRDAFRNRRHQRSSKVEMQCELCSEVPVDPWQRWPFAFRFHNSREVCSGVIVVLRHLQGEVSRKA